jgi:hypothetical protein
MNAAPVLNSIGAALRKEINRALVDLIHLRRFAS